MRCACLSNVMRNISYNTIHESNLVMRYTRKGILMKFTNGEYVKILKGDVMRCTYLKVIMKCFNGSV